MNHGFYYHSNETLIEVSHLHSILRQCRATLGPPAVCSIGDVGPTKTKVIIFTWYVKFNESVTINKFQSDFDFSAKVAHICVTSIY